MCEAVAPKALIGVSVSAARDQPRAVRDRRAHIFVRFVLGFGEDLPDGVVSLDEALRPSRNAAARGAAAQVPRSSPSPRARGAPLRPVFRSEDELLAQGAMTVLALSLDSRDVILNPYPLTGPLDSLSGSCPG